MIVACICAFCGRHHLVEKVMRCFINQDYEGKHYLILYNNSPVSMELNIPILPQNKVIVLINRNEDVETGKAYTSTGAIFRDALSYVPDEVKVITHMDSDDIYLPNHISEGVKGMKKAYSQGKLAYKPQFSFFIGGDKWTLESNTMEPSIFIDAKFLRNTGYFMVSSSYNQKWQWALWDDRKILIDGQGIPTFIYNWEKDHGTHKISGKPDSEENFKEHRKWSCDYGDLILTPAPAYEVQYYYNLTKINV